MDDDAAEAYARTAQDREDERGDLLATKKKRMEKIHERANGETCNAYRERQNADRKELWRGGGKDDASTWRAWLADRIGQTMGMWRQPTTSASAQASRSLRCLSASCISTIATESREPIGANEWASERVVRLSP